MRKRMKWASRIALVAGGVMTLGSAANAAALLTFAGGTGGLSPGETDYANFDTTFGTVVQVGGGGIFNGTTPGTAAEPAFGDQGDDYYAVLSGGSATFTFATPISQLGFDLGSADDYNSVTLTFVGGATQTFSGAQLNPPGPATGNQVIAGTNGRVTIVQNDMPAIISARFSSNQNSFEFDNLGIAPLPEPSSWALLIFGFGAVGYSMRRRKFKYRLQAV